MPGTKRARAKRTLRDWLRLAAEKQYTFADPCDVQDMFLSFLYRYCPHGTDEEYLQHKGHPGFVDFELDKEVGRMSMALHRDRMRRAQAQRFFRLADQPDRKFVLLAGALDGQTVCTAAVGTRISVQNDLGPATCDWREVFQRPEYCESSDYYAPGVVCLELPDGTRAFSFQTKRRITLRAYGVRYLHMVYTTMGANGKIQFETEQLRDTDVI